MGDFPANCWDVFKLVCPFLFFSTHLDFHKGFGSLIDHPVQLPSDVNAAVMSGSSASVKFSIRP